MGDQSWDAASNSISRLVNGSFEFGLSNWVMTGNTWSSVMGATDGINAVAFNIGQTAPTGSLAQEFSTVAGRTYTLTFDVGAVAFNQDEQRLRITVQGATDAISNTISVRGIGNGSINWQPQSITFVAAGSTGSLRFEDVSPTSFNIDLLLDHVELSTPVLPSPVFSMTAGNALNLQLNATDGQDSSANLIYGLSSGPTGAEMTSKGLFTWTPSSTTLASTNLVTIRVNDLGDPSLSDEKSFIIRIAALPPRITNTAPSLVTVDGRVWDALADSGNRLINGSFEDGLANWTMSGNTWSSVMATSDGAKAVAFNIGQTTPNGRLAQEFATVAGRTYKLTFDLGVIAFNQTAQTLRVTLQGSAPEISKTVTVYGSNNGLCVWQAQSIDFVAGASSTTLIFEDVSSTSINLDMMLDRVQVAAQVLPPPVFSVTAGNALRLQLTAVDTQEPSTNLLYALVSGPTGASVTTSGLFVWTPSSTAAASTNLITVRVTDHGQPALEDTKGFVVQVAAVPVPAPTNRLVNGSFENKLANWTASGNTWSSTLGASAGSKSIAFNIGQTAPNGRLSQAFSTVAGRTYTVSFDAGVIAFNRSEQRLRVSVKGATTTISKTISLFGNGTGGCVWQAQSLTFVAASTGATLGFEDISPTSINLDLLLDKVQVIEKTQVAPASWAAAETPSTSDDASLESATPAPASLVKAVAEDGAMRLTFQVTGTGEYHVRWSADLNTEQWEEVPADWAAHQGNGTWEIRVPLDMGSQGFFRFDPTSNLTAQLR